MASKVFNGRNELSTLRRCPSDTYLGFKRIGQASLSAGSPQKHTQHSCIFSPALILGWVMVAVELLEARQRDRRCCAPGWPLSCEHCPSSTPQLEQFSSHTNCADHLASSPWTDETESQGQPRPTRPSGTWSIKRLRNVSVGSVDGRLGLWYRTERGPTVNATACSLCDRG